MLMRWNDFGFGDHGFDALNGLRQEMDRVFQRFEHTWPGERSTHAASAWPQVQLRDAREELQLTADLPGFKAEDLHISLEQDTLTIRGERKDQVPDGYSVHRKERGAVRFARSFMLPARVETDKVEAKLNNGVLELRLPKVAEERPRTITVKAS